MKRITRRGFLAGAAVTAGMLGLAACANGTTEKLPSADAYPIDPDGSNVKAKWTSEETRDGWTLYTNPDGQDIGVMDTAKVIQVDGLAFRDVNGNGKLDFFEDWRQPNADRAKALAESLSAEDIFTLVWAGADQAGGMGTDTEGVGLIEEGSRAGVSRLQSSEESYASDIAWINKVQEACEQSELGIPYFNYSDPYSLFNVPSSAGLAACMDKDIWRKAGMWQARAWRATGVRCELGPQIDIYTNPIGTRLSGSVSEDPALNRDFAKAFGGGMQSTWGDDEATDDQGWGKESCAVMLKHFVGEGAPEGGRNDHTDSGKWSVFPGSNYNAHTIPFLDGGLHLDSKTEQCAAIMPCYGICYDPNDPDGLGEHVGSSYSKYNISILRNAGFDGMLTTDWMILEHIPWGVKNLDVPERFAKLMMNSISQHGGSFQPDVAKEAYDLMVKEMGEEAALEQMRENARRMFKPMMDVQLFEQPYSSRETAKAILTNEKAKEFGESVADKCVIMLKNNDVIKKDGMTDKPKVYIPRKFTAAQKRGFGGGTPANIDLCLNGDFVENYFDVVTDGAGDPTGEAGDDGKPTYQASDIKLASADELKDVKYAIVAIDSPTDAYQGVEGGQQFMPVGDPDQPYDPPVWKPVSLQYRPFTADKDYVPKESLNPADEFGNYDNRSVYGQSTHATNEADLDLVLDVRKRIPADAKLIVIVKMNRPMVFSELEPTADVILTRFDSKPTDESFARIITGKVEPTGLLPYQMPKDMETVFKQKEDVPRDMDCYVDANGNTYDFCFGLNWSGVINDERVATYKVDPLTQPEAKLQPEV